MRFIGKRCVKDKGLGKERGTEELGRKSLRWQSNSEIASARPAGSPCPKVAQWKSPTFILVPPPCLVIGDE